MANEGIMNLPQGQEMQQQAGVPDTRALDSMAPNSGAYKNINKNLQDLDPRMVAQYKAAIEPVLARLNLSADQIDKMIQFFDYLSAHKDQYKEILQRLISEGGMQPGDLPEEYNGTLIAVIQLILHQKKGDSSFQDQQGIGSLPQGQGQSERPPFAMKEGGLVGAAKHLQSMGRNGDKILAHINPQEAEILKRMGGSGTINPATGLMEFGFFSDVWQGVKDFVAPVVDVAKQIIASPVGKIVATVALSMFLGPAGAAYGGGFFSSAAVAAGVAGAGISAVGGGSLKDIVKSGLMAYAGSTLMSNIGGTSTPTPNDTAMGPGDTGVTSPMDAPPAPVSGAELPPADVGGTATPGAGIPPSGAIQGINAVGDASTLPPASGANDFRMVNTGGAGNGSPESITYEQAQYLKEQPGVKYTDTDKIITPKGTFVRSGSGYELSDAPAAAPAAPGAPVAPPPNAKPSFGEQFAAHPYDTTVKYLTQGGNSPEEWAKIQTDAANRSLVGLSEDIPVDAKAAIAKKAYDAAGPGMLTQYGPTAALVGAGAYLAGGFNKTPVDQNPLGKTQTSADYVAAHPEFANYKGWEPGVPSVNSPVPTTQTTPTGTPPLAPNSPYTIPTGTPPLAPNSPYTIPMGTSTGRAPGSSITQPYNVAGLYTKNGIGGLYNPNMPIPMNTGGEINNPEHSGTGIQPTMTSSFAGGGIGTLSNNGYARGGYPEKVGKIDGPGTGTSDSIPAMLSDGEFVFTAKAVRNAGKGNRREGAKKMYQLMHMLEHGGSVKGA